MGIRRPIAALPALAAVAMLFTSAALPATGHQLIGLCTSHGFRMVELPARPGDPPHQPDCALACHAAPGERRRGKA